MRRLNFSQKMIEIKLIRWLHLKEHHSWTSTISALAPRWLNCAGCDGWTFCEHVAQTFTNMICASGEWDCVFSTYVWSSRWISICIYLVRLRLHWFSLIWLDVGLICSSSNEESQQIHIQTMFNNQTTQSIRGGTFCGAKGLNLTNFKSAHRCPQQPSSTADIRHLQWTYLPRTPVCTLDVCQSVTLYPAQITDLRIYCCWLV